MVTISLQRDKFVIQDNSLDVLYEANLDIFFLFELKQPDNQKRIIQKKEYYSLHLNLMPDRYMPSYETLSIYCGSVGDRKKLINAINSYNSSKTKYIIEMDQRASSTLEKYIHDPILIKYADSLLSENESYGLSYYKCSLNRILCLKSSYRRFIYGCLVYDILDEKTKNSKRFSLINTALGSEIQQSDLYSGSFFGNSRLIALVNLFVERTGENELVCRFLAYYIMEDCLFRANAKRCSLYNIFESMSSDVVFSPDEVIQYYLQQNPSLVRADGIYRIEYESLLACFLLHKTYKCSNDVAIEAFWNDVTKCKDKAEVYDLISADKNIKNQFGLAVNQIQEKDRKKLIDYMFMSVNNDVKDHIRYLYNEIYNTTIFQTFDRFIKMIPESIKENIVVFSSFIEEYLLHEYKDSDQEKQICYAICSCNNMQPRRRQKIITPDLYRKLDMYKALLQKQFPNCIGYEGYIIVLGIIKQMTKIADDINNALFAEISDKSIEQRINRLVNEGLLQPNNINSTTMFIFSLYGAKVLESFMGIPLYNQYQHVFKMIQKEYDNLAQSYFEKQLMGEKASDAIMKYTIDYVDLLNGIEFESLIARLFQAMGYAVTITQTSNDQGIDVIAERLSLEGNEKIGIQAKCYSSSVGNSAIQEVVAGMAYYKLNKAIVVTNNYFTKGAIKLAAANNVALWDRRILSNKLCLLK